MCRWWYIGHRLRTFLLHAFHRRAILAGKVNVRWIGDVDGQR